MKNLEIPNFLLNLKIIRENFFALKSGFSIQILSDDY